MALSDRIEEVRATSGLSKADLARAAGVSPAAVTHWLNGNSQEIKGPYAAGIQAKTGFSAAWIASGKGPKMAATSNVEPGPDIRGLVPLISWIQAGSWQGTANPLHPGEAEEWLQTPTKCSSSSYALRVRGDSMTAAHGNSRSYPEGSIIFVDPERRMPVNGDRVVAKLVDSDEVTFKVYKNEDGRQWLHPLNPTHEPIRQPFIVLGTIAGTWIPE